jgi:hypothetical protein
MSGLKKLQNQAQISVVKLDFFNLLTGIFFLLRDGYISANKVFYSVNDLLW